MIKIDDTVNYTGTAEQLVALFLEDVPVQELQGMQVVNIDELTYGKGLSVYTDAGYIFPEKLLEVQNEN
jgi:hypothetical protein